MANIPLIRTALLLLSFIGSHAGAECPAVNTASIHAIKGHAAVRTPLGAEVTVEGVVSGNFLGGRRLDGFWLQTVPDGKRLPVGVFVYMPGPRETAAAKVAAGNRIQLTGRVKKFKGRIQLVKPRAIRRCSGGEPPTAVKLSLPATDERLARFEDLRIRLPRPLTVTGNGDLGRYGTLDLSSGGRLFRPTHAPGIEAASNAARHILLDDGSYRFRPRPIPYLDDDGTRRAGSRVSDVEGILTHAFGKYRIHPVRPPAFRQANPRRPIAAPRQNHWRVAVFNVENYFTTTGSRGAANQRELERQTGKLLRAIRGLRADVLALAEIENSDQALRELVAGLNRKTPSGVHYRAAEVRGGAGPDEIRSALVYRADRLEVAAARSDPDPVHSRPPLAALFQPLGKGALPFGVITVHFKSKSGCPGSGDVDRGEGCWNRLRVQQARALARFAREFGRETGVEELLIAGDVNAYADEAPVRELRTAGFTDLLAVHLPPETRYTYVYRGEAGYLDHALASPGLARRVHSAGIWHINADEPPFLAYEGAPEQVIDTPYRSSDHDPLVIDLE